MSISSTENDKKNKNKRIVGNYYQNVLKKMKANTLRANNFTVIKVVLLSSLFPFEDF
jgi:hypothetical protein